MSRKLSGMLILCVSALCLCGCFWMGAAGPCYGVGCPAGTEGANQQEKLGQPPRAQNVPPPAPNSPAPAQTAASLKKTPAPSAAAPSSTPASAAASPAAQSTTASASAKQPWTHSFTEFFARLLPHRSSDAKPAPGD
ncbi:MAG: hypothetical protein WA192_09210 [Candidatus Acidiferrales bacterium]